MNIVREKWNEILETVKNEHELTDISYKTWLKPLEVYSVDETDHMVTILVPSEQMGVSYIEKKLFIKEFLVDLLLNEFCEWYKSIKNICF